MSNSNDVNNSLVGYNSLALPAEQNRELKGRIGLCEMIFLGLHNDQECNDALHELVNFLIRNNQMLLVESITGFLSNNKYTFDYRRHVLKEMIYFVKAGQMNAFYDFCYKNIDSPHEEYHDYLRGAQGSWHKAVLAASYLASYNVPVFIGTCVTPKTLADLDAMAKLAQEIGVKGLTLTKIFMSGRAFSHEEELILSEEDTKTFLNKAMKLKKNTKDIVINFSTQSIQDALQDDTGTTNYQIPIIRPDAKMRLSCFEPVIVGDVLNEDIQVLWERYKQIRTSLKKAPEKIKATGRNYVDEEISYVEIL